MACSVVCVQITRLWRGRKARGHAVLPVVAFMAIPLCRFPGGGTGATNSRPAPEAVFTLGSQLKTSNRFLETVYDTLRAWRTGAF